jgi:hypothetical protein
MYTDAHHYKHWSVKNPFLIIRVRNLVQYHVLLNVLCCLVSLVTLLNLSD